MVEILNEEILPRICRLCLKSEITLAASLLEDEMNEFNKISLSDRIFEFFAVKIGKSDGLPTNICSKCLEFINSVTDFRNNVRKCEARLQNYIASIGILGVTDLKKLLQPSSTQFEFDDNLPTDEDFFVTVVDPNQDFYEYSNDSLGNNEYPNSSTNLLAQQLQQNSDLVTNMIINPISSTGFSTNETTQIISAESQMNLEQSNQNPKNSLESKLKFPVTDTDIQASIVQNVFLCQYCDYAFKTKFECVDHEEKHDQVNPHACGICNYKCAERQGLINHIKVLHETDKPYICGFCKKSFGRRTDLKKHTIIHTGVRPFCCPLCPKSFSRNANLTKHLRLHDKTLLPEIQKPFKCTKCPLTFIVRERLLQHEQLSHIETMQTANMFSSSLDQHYTVNQSNVQNQLLLQQSQTQATPPQPRKQKFEICIICAKVFPRKKELQRHMAIHINELQFSCSYCSKKFNRKEKLKRHELIHREKFSCTMCNKAFLKQDILMLHMKTHEIEKLDEPMDTGNQQQSFLTSLQQGFRPQLNFYSELSPEDAKITTPF